jgi:hypothetical protein
MVFQKNGNPYSGLYLNIMESIWKQENLAEQFERDGYIVIDFLTDNALMQLREIYRAEQFPISKTFYSSSFLPDKEHKASISQNIREVMDPYVEEVFVNYKKLGAVFLIKPTGENSIMPIHQDWTVVDETKFDAMTVWIPLQDTTEENGCIRVLPRSHRLSKALRAPTLQNPLKDILEEAEQLMVPLPMKAGQAFIFSHALLHASFPNLSAEPRLAVAYGVLHQEAQLIYYFRENTGDALELLEVPDDFFLNYPAPGQRPEGALCLQQLKSHQDAVVSVAHFKNYYGIIEAKPGFWQKVRGYFSA